MSLLKTMKKREEQRLMLHSVVTKTLRSTFHAWWRLVLAAKVDLQLAARAAELVGRHLRFRQVDPIGAGGTLSSRMDRVRQSSPGEACRSVRSSRASPHRLLSPLVPLCPATSIPETF